MKTPNLTGTIDEHGQLHLDQPIPDAAPGRVRVILLPVEAAEVQVIYEKTE